MKKITLKENGTFEHVWLPTIHTIPAAAIEVSDADFMLLSQNPQTKAWLDGVVVDYVAAFDWAQAILQKQGAINSAFNTALDSISQLYTRQEIDSWPTQKDEATAWHDDNAEVTPLIDAIVANRPSVDKAILVSRILTNSANYKAISGVALGKKQAFEDTLYALPSNAIKSDFDAIVVAF